MPKTPKDNPIVPLNLPAAALSLRQGPRGAEVYDTLRRKWLMLTPEEWVRQNFVHYLHTECGYPMSMMANEVAIRLNDTLKRCDTVVYSPALRPMAIVEYKAPDVQLTREVFEQIIRYNIVLDVDHLIISNGLCHYCCRVSRDGARPKVEFLDRIPEYGELSGD